MAGNNRGLFRVVEIMLVIFLAIISAIVFHFTAYSGLTAEVRANSENIHAIEKHFGARFDGIEKKIDRLDVKVEKIDDKVDRLLLREPR